MSNIRSVEARTVSIPLPSPTSFSTRVVHERHYVLVRVIDSDGVQGLGFCYPGSSAGRLVAEAVRGLVAPLVVGRDPREVRALWRETYAATLLHGRAGAAMRALSAVDIALWDCKARAVGDPLWLHLGANAHESVPAYASGGYYLEGKGPQQLADEVAGYVAMGFDAVKIKVGRLTAREDGVRIAAAREAIGPDRALMLDANNAWTHVDQAEAALRLWEPHDPYWIEEPFSPDDIRSHARLSRRTSITVATGEIEAGRWRHWDLIEQQAAQVLQTDAAVCGGITEFIRIAGMCASAGVALCPHWFHDLHVHLVAATEAGRYVEFFPDDNVLNFRRLVTNQLEVMPGGRLRLPTGAGLGFDFDHEIVEAFAIDEWK